MDLTGNGDHLTTGDRFARSYARKHGLPDPTTAPETTMKLVIHHPDAVNDPYPIDLDTDLEDAIRQEARVVASDAGSDLLAEGTEEERIALEYRIFSDALKALRGVGDSYTDPAGIRWTLEG